MKDIMEEGVQEYLMEMFDRLNIKIIDDDHDIINEYAESIVDSITEGYQYTSDAVADNNLRQQRRSEENDKLNNLQKEIDALYQAAQIKGYNFNYKNGVVYETGTRYVGGTVRASFERRVT